MMSDQAKILIAEDEPAQAEVLKYNLQAAGYDVSIAPDGAEALMRIEEDRPDLLVLDWMLPEVSGIEVCRRLRKSDDYRDLPIVMLTARGEEDDRIRGLDVGADDYMVKPYSPGELLARINAVLRRARPALTGETLEYDDLILNLAARKVSRAGQTLHLAPTEFRILQALMERPGRVLSRQQIIDLAWGPNVFIEDRTVDVHIKRLRSVLSKGDFTDPIRTVRGFGYSLDADPDA
ncbi:MAG: phosphate regulon transcriptional regulatory protein PhoB [Alphaproteobacteria bacterium]|nr:MAG: phosphate regulon transcriptional regulatory protein PhoB [Alphaproteobacteria bacterium]